MSLVASVEAVRVAWTKECGPRLPLTSLMALAYSAPASEIGYPSLSDRLSCSRTLLDNQGLFTLALDPSEGSLTSLGAEIYSVLRDSYHISHPREPEEMAIRIRIRGPNSTETVQAQDDWTMAELVALIRDKMGVQHFSLKAGFPPVDLDVATEGLTLNGLNLNGSTLSLVPLEPQAEEGTSHPASKAAPRSVQTASMASAAMPAPSFQPKKVEVDETVVEWTDGGGYLSTLPMDHSRDSYGCCL